jgi:hypothetical protein
MANFFSAPASAAALAVLTPANGDIVAAGQASSGSSPSRFAVARFTGLGQPDPTFGKGGLVTTSFGQMDSVAAVALQTDGKIIAARNSTGNSQFGPITSCRSRSLHCSIERSGQMTRQPAARERCWRSLTNQWRGSPPGPASALHKCAMLPGFGSPVWP